MTAEADSGPKPWARSADTAEGEMLVVLNRQQDLAVNGDRWAALMRRVICEEGVATPWEVALSFVTAVEIAALNYQYRGKDCPTDVLAFGAEDDTVPRADEEPRLLGDVVICPFVAARNATARGQRVKDELALLVVHGTLHLLGYDHIDDVEAAAMQKREQELLAGATKGAAVAR